MSEEKRKLIFFWPYLEWGGAQIYFVAIIKEALAEWDITVILPRRSAAEIVRFVEHAGAKIEFLDFHSDLSAAPTIAQKIRRQYRRIRTEVASFRYLKRFDLRKCVLHIDFPPWQSWIFFVALSLRRANVFMTMHNALPNEPAWRVVIWKIRLQILSRLSGFHLFTSNHDTKNKLRGWVSEQFWPTIKVTYTCVNPPEIKQIYESPIDRARLRRKINVEADKFVVISVGQFIDRKGRWVLLEAAKAVTSLHPDAVFVWLSPTIPSEDDLARVHGYGLGDSFRLVLSESVGKTHEDVLRFFRIADVFALPSYVEGLPIALLEAMALGIPSISTDVYAIPEAVKHLETGMLIDAGDHDALAETVIRLKNDRVLRSRLATAGSKFVLEHFDERRASQIAIDAYKGRMQNVG